MIRHKQLNRHNPAKGIYGDCYRTVVACLLDLEPSEVPHPFESGLEENAVGCPLSAWLADRNLGLASIYSTLPLPLLLAEQKALNPGVRYILTGMSNNGVPHNVICLEDFIDWDPSQDDSGIVGPVDGYYWLTWITPIDIGRSKIKETVEIRWPGFVKSDYMVYVTKQDIVSSFMESILRQADLRRPMNLNAFRDELLFAIDEQEHRLELTFDSLGVATINFSHLRRICNETMRACPSIRQLNLTYSEIAAGMTDPEDPSRPLFSFSSRYEETDRSFVDLDALSRNVANSILTHHQMVVNS